MNGKISLFSLVLLMVASIASIRTLPTTAFFGGPLLYFYLAAAILFLVPIAFISAEFSSRDKTDGGVFHWVKSAFGEKFGLLAVWLQWINTMVWYPTMLLFIAATAAHLISPILAESKLFLFFFSLSAFWILTLVNLKGIQISVRINSICGIVGTLIPILFLIGCGAWWLFTKPSILSFALPSMNILDSSNALVTIMASFLGMELAGVHTDAIQNPQKTFPKAIGYTVFALLFTLVLGSLAVAAAIPAHEIRFADGVIQTFSTFLNALHIPFLTPIIAFLIIFGAAGGSINWLLSPAKGLLQAAEYGFLPPYFLAKNNKRILFFQAIVVSIFCCAIQLIDSLNAYYWLLMALSTGLYMLLYILLFLAALKLKRPSTGYQIPKGLRTLSCISGLFSSLLTLAIGFQPPAGLNLQPGQYFITIAIGFCLMLAPAFFLIAYQKKLRLYVR